MPELKWLNINTKVHKKSKEIYYTRLPETNKILAYIYA